MFDPCQSSLALLPNGRLSTHIFLRRFFSSIGSPVRHGTHAANEEFVREHARRCEFPLDRVSRVATMIDPDHRGGRVGTATAA